MKKLLFLLVAVLAIAGFSYYYFSTPKILERRLDSLLDSLSFGTVSLGSVEKDADDFASHFAPEIEFSGSGNSIIMGTVSPDDLRALYLNQYRAAAKNSQAKRTGDFHVELTAADQAEMDATIELTTVLRDNTSYPQDYSSSISLDQKGREVAHLRGATPVSRRRRF